MGFHESLDVVSDVLDGYRSQGRPVRRVDVTTAETGSDALRVTLDVPVSLRAASDGEGAELTPERAALTDGGRLRIELPAGDVAAPPSSTDAVVSTDERDVRVDDGDLVLTVELTVDPTADGTGATEDADADATGGEETPGESDPLAAVRDESVPPYEDTEYLGALYDARDSFAEMSREIPMDVSAETVRRYMIEAGVHEPTTYDTSAGGTERESKRDPASAADPIVDVADEPLVTDGVGLPSDLNLRDVVDAVVDARTTYEVHRQLGIGQERTRDLLKQLDLQDFVLRRVDDDPDRRVSYEQVTARIRQSVPREA